MRWALFSPRDRWICIAAAERERAVFTPCQGWEGPALLLGSGSQSLGLGSQSLGWLKVIGPLKIVNCRFSELVTVCV